MSFRRAKKPATTSPIHSTLDPSTNGKQSVKSATALVDPVSIIVKSCRLEEIFISTGLLQADLFKHQQRRG